MNELFNWLDQYPESIFEIKIQGDYLTVSLWKIITNQIQEYTTRISKELILDCVLDWQTLVIKELERLINEGSNPSPR